MPPSTPGDPATVCAVRDLLAEHFANALRQEESSVREILELRLAGTPDRDKWRPLKDAIEILRTICPSLDKTVATAVRKRFDAKIAPRTDAFSNTATFSADSLSLVSEDEVQEEIAVGNATRRLREAAADDLFALNSRLAMALGRDNIAEEISPVHPRIFASALLDVITEAAPDHVSRLLAFSAYDPALMQALQAAYRDANALLVARGFLPEFRRSYGAPQQQAPRARIAAAGAPADTLRPFAQAPVPSSSSAASGSHALFDRLIASASAPAATSAAPAPESLVTLHVRPDVVDALRAIEARLDGQRGASADLAHPVHEESATPLTPADGLVADLVAAVFARLLTDPHLSDAAKIQLGRLQFPVLKAVTADRRFFTEPGHPIRGLIDAVAELGATADAQHPIGGRLPEEWLASELQALLDTNAFDSAVFAAARDRLTALVERHNEELADNDSVVKSVRSEEESLAATRDSALEIVHRISACECSEAAAAFVYRAWRPVLIHDHRTAGQDSPQWNADLRTLDDLLWTLLPRVTAPDRRKLEDLMPSLRYRLWQGLILAQLPTAEIEALLEEMDRLHAHLRHSPGAAARELSTTFGVGKSIGYDFTATLRVSSSEILEEGLTRGAWFEFTENDGTKFRARLNWVSPIQGACVFKDPAQNRSFAILLADLREKRQAGRAIPVQGPGVALSSIEGALAEVAQKRGA